MKKNNKEFNALQYLLNLSYYLSIPEDISVETAIAVNNYDKALTEAFSKQIKLDTTNPAKIKSTPISTVKLKLGNKALQEFYS